MPPFIVFRTCQTLCYSVLLILQGHSPCHVADDQTETQRGEVICPKLWGYKVAELSSEPRSVELQSLCS